MGVHTTNSTMKNVISKSPMEKSKRIADHSVRKTLVKRLKQNNVAKSEIISITGHSTEEGLDTFDSGDKKQHQAISNAIDDCRIKPFSHRQHFIPPNDPRNLNPTFSFFQQADFQQNTLPLYAPINISTTAMFKCIKIHQLRVQLQSRKTEPLKKRRRVTYSSDSSQEI